MRSKDHIVLVKWTAIFLVALVVIATTFQTVVYWYTG